MARMAILMSREDLVSLGYPVVVEMWDKVGGRGASGSKRRKYHAEFNEAERRKMQELYKLFYDWYLRRGTPAEFMIRNLDAWQFMQRVCNFFGTI